MVRKRNERKPTARPEPGPEPDLTAREVYGYLEIAKESLDVYETRPPSKEREFVLSMSKAVCFLVRGLANWRSRAMYATVIIKKLREADVVSEDQIDSAVTEIRESDLE